MKQKHLVNLKLANENKKLCVNWVSLVAPAKQNDFLELSVKGVVLHVSKYNRIGTSAAIREA